MTELNKDKLFIELEKSERELSGIRLEIAEEIRRHSETMKALYQRLNMAVSAVGVYVSIMRGIK